MKGWFLIMFQQVIDVDFELGIARISCTCPECGDISLGATINIRKMEEEEIELDGTK